MHAGIGSAFLAKSACHADVGRWRKVASSEDSKSKGYSVVLKRKMQKFWWSLQTNSTNVEAGNTFIR